jgi:hypothetical protein
VRDNLLGLLGSRTCKSRLDFHAHTPCPPWPVEGGSAYSREGAPGALLWTPRTGTSRQRVSSIGDAAPEQRSARLHAIYPCSPLDENLYRSTPAIPNTAPRLARNARGLLRVRVASERLLQQPYREQPVTDSLRSTGPWRWWKRIEAASAAPLSKSGSERGHHEPDGLGLILITFNPTNTASRNSSRRHQPVPPLFHQEQTLMQPAL